MVNQLNGGSVGSVGSLSDLIEDVRTWFGTYIKVIDETDLDVLSFGQFTLGFVRRLSQHQGCSLIARFRVQEKQLF